MVKIGVLGAYRGSDFAKAALDFTDAAVTAICERDTKRIEWFKDLKFGEYTYFTDFDKMLQSDIDAVILCNYLLILKSLSTSSYSLSDRDTLCTALYAA